MLVNAIKIRIKLKNYVGFKSGDKIGGLVGTVEDGGSVNHSIFSEWEFL